jgi:hypothetical protein
LCLILVYFPHRTFFVRSRGIRIVFRLFFSSMGVDRGKRYFRASWYIGF